MQSENWIIVKEILRDTLEIEPSKRQEFLDKAEITDEIRAEIESLLAFEEESEDFMSLGITDFSKDFMSPEEEAETLLVGQKIGIYEIISELGYGGMGAVYLATRADGKFSQRVALKLLKREMNTAALRRRFEQEREILASLEHPNIARLLDAGMTDDKIPFLAMEYVEGLPIDEYCNKYELDLSQRLDLFRKVCSAVNFAHRNLIVHRDLKPSNILVNEERMPKLLDFGISKILSMEFEQINAATVTKLGVMTPSYASPEQLQSKSVTTATDIYSLGVILYELLSGHRPFEAKEDDLKEIYQAVLENEPPPPSALIDTNSKKFKEQTEAKTEIKLPEDSEAVKRTIKFDNDTQSNKIRHTIPRAAKLSSQSLRGDLDNIVLKALRKEPERRYSSAENLAEDIHRHQRGLPVAARPNTFSYRAEKFIKRNRASVFAGTLIVLAIIAGIVATLWQARIAQAERTIAQTERAKAENRFNDVRTLANSFLFEFSPLIETLPGSTPARELLVRRALEYLDNLSQESGEDLELQRELAAAYEKVGDVQGNPNNPNVGDVQGAIASFEKAQAIRRRLLETEAENIDEQNRLAENLEKLGAIAINGGSFDKAEGVLTEALEIRKLIVISKPQDVEARFNLAKTYRSASNVPFYQGKFADAIKFFDAPREILEKLVKEKPDDTKIAQLLGNIYIDIGETTGWLEDYEGGGEYIRKGLDFLAALVEKNPNDFSLWRSLTIGYLKRGENLLDLEKTDDSLAAYNKSLQLATDSVKIDPRNFQAKRDLILVNKQRAKTLASLGKTAESIEGLKAAIGLLGELRADDAGNRQIPYDIGSTAYELGEIYYKSKNYTAAAETFQTAIDSCRYVQKINPAHAQSKRIVAISLEGKGRTQAALAGNARGSDDLKNALENFRASLELFNQIKAEARLFPYDEGAMKNAEKKIAEIEAKL